MMFIMIFKKNLDLLIYIIEKNPVTHLKENY
jgi:hypothetical protein